MLLLSLLLSPAPTPAVTAHTTQANSVSHREPLTDRSSVYLELSLSLQVLTPETQKSDTTGSRMAQSSSVRRDEKCCIFRTSCAIATELEIKDYYMMKKNPEPPK